MSTALFALNSSSFAIELRQHRLYRVESTMADSVPLLLELEEGFTFRGRPVVRDDKGRLLAPSWVPVMSRTETISP